MIGRDTSNEVVVVDSCTSIQHTTGCRLRGSFAGDDETCTPVAEQCDLATASWQAGQAYVPGSIENPSTTCPDGCIFRKAVNSAKPQLVHHSNAFPVCCSWTFCMQRYPFTHAS